MVLRKTNDRPVNRTRRRVEFAITVAIGLVCGSAQSSPALVASEREWFVSPKGDDSNAGTEEAPLATIERARELARAEREGDAFIRLMPGVHRLTETLVFDRRDQRLGGAVLTLGATQPGEVALSGAQPVAEQWRPSPSLAGVWQVELPAEWGEVRTVFGPNGQMPRARSAGYRQLDEPPADVAYRQRRAIDGRHLYLPREALNDIASFAGAEMRVIPRYPWLMNLQPVDSVEPSSGLVRSEVPSIYPLTGPAFGRFPEGTVWIENLPCALDEEGAWVFDVETRRLLVKSEGRPEQIEAAVLTELVRIEGEQNEWDYVDRPVSGIRLEGITFSRAGRHAWTADKTGWGLQHDWEMYDRPTAMVRLRFAERCTVVDCRFVESGAAGLRLDLHARDNEIRRCEFSNLGGVGVLLAGYGMGWKDVNGRNVVADCTIEAIGREWWGSPAIFVWQSGDNRIVHNRIRRVPYSGIVVSGRTQLNVSGLKESSRTARWEEVINHLEGGDRSWQAREPLMHGRRNEVAWNDISAVMQILSDGNAIYISGTGGGNHVHQNFIHDIDSPNINASIRTDDDQYEVVIERNVIARCTGEGIVLKGANTLRHNLVYDLRPRTRDGVAALFQRGFLVLSGEPISGSPIEGNAFVSLAARQIPVMERPQPWVKRGRSMPPVTLASARANRNLWWCTVDPSWGSDWIAAQRAAGVEANSVAMDPHLVDPEGDDFRVRDDAPAAVREVIGDGWDVSRAGPR